MRARHWNPSISELALDSVLDIGAVLKGELRFLGVLFYLGRSLRNEFSLQDLGSFSLSALDYNDARLIHLHKHWCGEEPSNFDDIRKTVQEIIDFIFATYFKNYNRMQDEKQLRRCHDLCLVIHDQIRKQRHLRRDLAAA